MNNNCDIQQILPNYRIHESMWGKNYIEMNDLPNGRCEMQVIYEPSIFFMLIILVSVVILSILIFKIKLKHG